MNPASCVRYALFLSLFSFVLSDQRGDILEVKQQVPEIDNNTKEIFLRLLTMRLPPFLTATRNSTGDIIELRGIVVPVLDWLSRVLHFKYNLLPDRIFSVEDNSAGKGTMSYLVEGVMKKNLHDDALKPYYNPQYRADMILGGVVMTSSRYKHLNFPYPFVFDAYGFMIPMPSPEVNIRAVWKPFQEQVWICLLITLAATTVFIYGIGYGISVVNSKKGSKVTNGEIFEDVVQAWQYVFGVILSQGIMAQKEASRNQKLTIRFLAGTWCITCFVLITAYSSVLISFVTSPYYKPLIDSINDIPKDPKIEITVDRGFPQDLLFTNAKNGLYKYLGDQLRRDPELRCSVSEQCLDRVRNGSAVYTIGYLNLINYMGMDLKKNGRCDFSITKERINSFSAGLALPKHADIEFYNRGMMKAHEGGFINLWYDRNVADASRCLNPVRHQDDDKIRLTLSGLSGAFVVLAIGYGISLFVLLCEVVYKFYHNAPHDL